MNGKDQALSHDDLLWQMRAIALAITSIANGDLSHKINLEAAEGAMWHGEQLELAKTINAMVDQLTSFAAEAMRISREIGTEGRLGGQMQVEGVTGAWKDLTDNINRMAHSLTEQVRDIASVTTSFATGDLTRKVTVQAQGEIDEIKQTLNVMVDQFNSFAAEVTRLSREIGNEGVFGGQINVRGASGTWQDLIHNLNTMSDKLAEKR